MPKLYLKFANNKVNALKQFFNYFQEENILINKILMQNIATFDFEKK